MPPLILVPCMLFLSSVVMAFAWLGHIRFRHCRFVLALLASWVMVLPEYLLNVSAMRQGHDIYTGAEMAAFNLCTGVLCVTLVSRFFLREQINRYQALGFLLMTCAIVLVVYD